MLKRALGYRRDELDSRDWDEGRLGLVASSSAPTSVLLGHQPPVYDQGRSSSCVAQAMAGAIEIQERKAAVMRGESPRLIKTPSRLQMYFLSRRAHAGGPAIFDTGTYPRVLAQVVERLGVADEEHWKFRTDPFTVNRRPSMVAMMRGKSRSGGQYYRIKSVGEQRIAAIKAALLEGYPVTFGTRVTSDFLSSIGPAIVDRPMSGSKFAGGHAMLIVGYKETGSGLVFDVRNSWGTGWRVGGHCWMTEDYMRWAHARDFQIVKGWKRIQGAA